VGTEKGENKRERKVKIRGGGTEKGNVGTHLKWNRKKCREESKLKIKLNSTSGSAPPVGDRTRSCKSEEEKKLA